MTSDCAAASGFPGRPRESRATAIRTTRMDLPRKIGAVDFKTVGVAHVRQAQSGVVQNRSDVDRFDVVIDMGRPADELGKEKRT
jgi:hypothetical protein